MGKEGQNFGGRPWPRRRPRWSVALVAYAVASLSFGCSRLESVKDWAEVPVAMVATPGMVERWESDDPRLESPRLALRRLLEIVLATAEPVEGDDWDGRYAARALDLWRSEDPLWVPNFLTVVFSEPALFRVGTESIAAERMLMYVTNAEIRLQFANRDGTLVATALTESIAASFIEQQKELLWSYADVRVPIASGNLIGRFVTAGYGGWIWGFEGEDQYRDRADKLVWSALALARPEEVTQSDVDWARFFRNPAKDPKTFELPSPVPWHLRLVYTVPVRFQFSELVVDAEELSFVPLGDGVRLIFSRDGGSGVVAAASARVSDTWVRDLLQFVRHWEEQFAWLFEDED